MWPLQVLAGVVFAALVPRLMGPEAYGRYALLTSVAAWCGVLGSLGLASVLVRHIPALRGDPGTLDRFLGRLLTVRVGGGAAAAFLLFAAVRRWLPGLDPVAVGFVAVSVFLEIVARLFFAILLGFNRAALWGVHVPARAWGVAVLVPLGYGLFGFRGACGALVVVQALLVAIGVPLARAHAGAVRPRWDIAAATPYVRVGAAFLLSQLVFGLVRQSGDVLVLTFSREYRQVGFFGLASNVYQMGFGALGQLAMAFVPMLADMRDRGRAEAAGLWVERLMVGLVSVAMVGAFGALALADRAVPRVFGGLYAPAVPLLFLVALTLAASVPLAVGGVLAVVQERPRTQWAAALIQLAVFWALGACAVGRRGALGAWEAHLGAALCTGAFLFWTFRGPGGMRVGPVAVSAGLGLPFLPLFGLATSLPARMVVLAGSAGAYAWLLRRSGLISGRDVSALIATFRRREPGAARKRGTNTSSDGSEGSRPRMVPAESFPEGAHGDGQRRSADGAARAHWDAVAEEWAANRPDSLWREHSDELLRLLLERWWPGTPVERALKTDLFDEAFGRGIHEFLSERCRAWVGVDLSCRVVKLAREAHPGCSGVPADVRRLPFADETFDVVVSPSTLDHLETPEEICAGLAEINRVLRPGGTLIITLDNPYNPVVALRRIVPFGILRRLGLVPYRSGATLGPRALRRALGRAGFSVVRVEAYLHCPRVFAVPLCRWVEARCAPTGRARLLAALKTFELGSRVPTRFVTGHFVAAFGVKR
ncbi:methyltransferase domain-containing protein [Deferrisoma sp.]